MLSPVFIFSLSEEKASHISSVIDDRMSSTKPSSLDINVGENLAFDDLDEEFYNIMRSKLNVEITSKEAVKLSVDEADYLGPHERIADGTTDTSLVEKLEKGNTTLASKSVPRVILKSAKERKATVKVQDLEMLPPTEGKMRKEEKQADSDDQVAILNTSCFHVPASDRPKQDMADQGKNKKGMLHSFILYGVDGKFVKPINVDSFAKQLHRHLNVYNVIAPFFQLNLSKGNSWYLPWFQKEHFGFRYYFQNYSIFNFLLISK